MGKRVWRVVVAGGAAAVFTAVAAAPAGAAEGGVSFSRVQVNGGKSIVIRVSKEVAVPASFRMATTHKWKWPAVFLYRGGAGDRLWHAIETSDCIKVSSGVCDFNETMYFDPSVWAMRNSEAGVKKVYANGSGDLRTTVKTSRTGTWRWVYYGNTTTGPSTSSGDNVVVK
ncbi:hypothetical protein ACFV5G_01130 [Streptomyces sp. NPDC059766]|uniref:hypothetical protein n=1 Tax=Streptomyces sp. NPDC059766 TaxID=3346940 RepID=UPI00364FBFF3